MVADHDRLWRIRVFSTSGCNGGYELTSESSFLKALLELGVLGMLPILLLLSAVVLGAIACWNHPASRQTPRIHSNSVTIVPAVPDS